MTRRAVRIATNAQLERSVSEAGFETYLLPPLPSLDFHRPLQQRIQDGAIYRPFLQANKIDLVVDFNTSALTFVQAGAEAHQVAVTTSALGIPYVACYLDPVTSTMGQVGWADHWQVLESAQWIKWVWETAHAEELTKFGVPNVFSLPMAAANDDFDTSPLPEPDDGPVIAFMGHPASTWFRSNQPVSPDLLFEGFTAAAVHADMPDLPFHKVYYDLYEFAEPPLPTDDAMTRARKAREYFDRKFIYNAYLAVKQRDRFARFLKRKLGDAFELVGDHWDTVYGLKHTPRIWDMKVLHERMRRVPICLNLMKGCLETGLNIRHFEITAHGGFMLTYPSAELGSCFVIGKECEVFRNEAELLEKIQYYVAHADKRRAIAAAGQRRTLSQHLYSHRITRLVEILSEAGVLATKANWQASAARCQVETPPTPPARGNPVTASLTTGR